MEVWKDIKDYEGLYQVSNFGRVKSLDHLVKHNKGGFALKKGRILNLTLDSKGYYVLDLSKNSRKKQYKVHRLVAEAFVPNPDNLPYIDHINTIRDDNRIENLRWVTQKENMNNPLTISRISENQKGEKGYWFGVNGKEHPTSRPVLQFDLDGIFVKKWDCINDAYKELQIKSKHIPECCNGKYHTCGGFIWKYA